MSYGGFPYGGVAYAGSNVDDIPADTQTTLAVEVSFTADPLSTPVWVDITPDVRSWSSQRGRSRDLERFQPGRATVVLSNLSAQYDSLNASGPWFGSIKPMKRMRIRETFSGVTYPVFDGFIDKWQLDYPNVGKDAIAIVTATDAFKVFARTELPRSVYTAEVQQDAPLLWWRLNEDRADPSTAALSEGSLGTAVNGTYVGPVKERGVQGLVFRDDGTAVQVVQPLGVIPESGITIDGSIFDLSDYGSFAIEFWTVSTGDLVGVDRWVQGDNLAGNARLAIQSASAGEDWAFRIVESTDVTEYGVTGNAAGFVSGTRYHVVAKFGPNKAMAIYVNGVKYTTTAAGATAPPLVGSLHPDMDIGFFYTFGDGLTPDAIGSEFAIYSSALGVDPLSDARITAHYNGGNTPWAGDTIPARFNRILDLSNWPANLRELDVGGTNLQATDLGGDALEYLQTIGESEYAGLFFITRDGKVRFRSRTSVLAREPYPVVFGDAAGEIGYIAFTPDDGDTYIRNRATVSRLGGIAKTAESATSKSQFGTFQYSLEGLFFDSDDDAFDYSSFVVDQYKDQRRRITSLELTTPITGKEATQYPAMLGPELGDAITFSNTPVGGANFTQICAIEGIEHSGQPKNSVRTTKFILSPEYPIRTLA